MRFLGNSTHDNVIKMGFVQERWGQFASTVRGNTDIWETQNLAAQVSNTRPVGRVQPSTLFLPGSSTELLSPS